MGRDVLWYLEDLGALRPVDHGWMLTARAVNARQQLAHPNLVWLQINWFPVGVLSVPALVGTGTTIAGMLQKRGD